MTVSERRPVRRGYSLAALIVVVTVVNVALAAAIPAYRQQIKREREAEAIHRGYQYAEAIRVFQQRQGRFPIRLEELIEVEPRCLRQLFDNPLSDDGAWKLIYASGVTSVQVEGEADIGRRPSRRRSSRNREAALGPILGVFPTDQGLATKIFLGSDLYKDWKFTPEIVPTPAVVPEMELASRANAGFAGRPFRPGLQPTVFSTDVQISTEGENQSPGLTQDAQPQDLTRPGRDPAAVQKLIEEERGDDGG